jgi:predicted amidohydrolase
MIIGYFQFSPEFGNIIRNLEKVQDNLSRIDADIIVLPELAFTGYYFEDRNELSTLAEDVSNSPTVNALIKFCKNNNLHIATGFAECEGNKIFNSALLIGPSGLIATYRKLHLFNTEKEYFDPGNIPLKPININGTSIGLMICYDWVFPEVTRSLAIQGVDIICHPSNLVLSYCQKTMMSRCIENGVYAITANRTGTEIRPRGELTFTGQSQIVNTKGEVLVCSKEDNDDLVLQEIDPLAAKQKMLTENNHLLNDRRPEYYDVLV